MGIIADEGCSEVLSQGLAGRGTRGQLKAILRGSRSSENCIGCAICGRMSPTQPSKCTDKEARAWQEYS